MTNQEIDDIILIKQGAIENLLKRVYGKINGNNNLSINR
jgi:DNA-binding CsgD family transcriptional regulator